MKKPAPLSVLLATLPFAGMCFAVPLWDRLEPRALGIPFNLAWIMAWLVLTPGIMTVVYRIERNR